MRWVLWGVAGLAIAVGVVCAQTLRSTADPYAAQRRAVVQLRALQIALDSYRQERNAYPGEPAPLETAPAILYHALIEDGGERGSFLCWDPSYVGADAEGRPVLLDPWGRPVHYHQFGPGEGDYVIASSGPDGELGTFDDLRGWPGSHAFFGQPPRVLPGPRILAWGVGLSALWAVWGLALWLGAFVARRSTPAPCLVTCRGLRAPQRCAWCHDHASPAELTGCDRCGVALHGECWALSPRCPTLGCAPRPARRRRRVVIALPAT